VVTHLAQVAAFAEKHLVVDKSVAAEGAVTRSDIRDVSGDDRVAELARMLGGETTTVALQHAAELLATAADERTETSRDKPAKRRTKP
jgi:DNA repair protein RecN (Recombination protein N)